MAKGNKFGYNVNRRRLWKKSKKIPTISCKPLKEAWDSRKSMEKNLTDMGLSVNPNKTIPIPTMKDKLRSKGTEGKKVSSVTKDPAKIFVLHALEDMANVPPGRTIRISQPLMAYCIHMLEKYGEDYKAMARDPKNYYQDTPKQIRKKINLFKSIPEQYEPYVKGTTTADTTDVAMDT